MTDDVTDRLSTADAAQSLAAVTDALATLRDEAAVSEPLGGMLTRLATAAVTAVPDADGITVTRLDGNAPHTIAVTDPVYIEVDSEQYASGRGPCLEAASTRRSVHAVVGEHTDRWPEFTDAARKAGIRAHLSVPLHFDSPAEESAPLTGSFNVYAITAVAFDQFDEKLMELLATATAATLGYARRWQSAQTRVGQLTEALTSRAEIDQAKGVMMAMHRISADEAFARLTDISQHTNTKVHAVARKFLDRFRESDRP